MELMGKKFSFYYLIYRESYKSDRFIQNISNKPLASAVSIVFFFAWKYYGFIVRESKFMA